MPVTHLGRSGGAQIGRTAIILGLMWTVGCGGDSETSAAAGAPDREQVLVRAPEGARDRTADSVTLAAPPGSEPSAEGRIATGAAVFLENCASCHQGGGQGIEGEVPPLAGSDFLNADRARAIEVVAHGLDGDIVVNGHAFANRMPSLGLSDGDIADVLTYVFSQWGNAGWIVTPAEVGAVRR